jgi:hypothetical protein
MNRSTAARETGRSSHFRERSDTPNSMKPTRTVTGRAPPIFESDIEMASLFLFARRIDNGDVAGRIERVLAVTAVELGVQRGETVGARDV